MPNKQIRISAKNLGQLALDNCCKRCFWLKLKLNFKLPFQMFPGIFSSLGSYSKKITGCYFEKFKTFPPWFNAFGEFEEIIPVPHWRKFYFIDKETKIKLSGVPDEILKKKNGSLTIIDYKTSKFTEAKNSLGLLYKAQLNSYAWIAEKLGLSPVGGLALIYYQPETDIIEISEKELKKLVSSDKFKMLFSAHLIEVELEPEKVVKPLLRKVRELADMKKAPDGIEGCEDCEKLERLVGLVGGR